MITTKNAARLRFYLKSMFFFFLENPKRTRMIKNKEAEEILASDTKVPISGKHSLTPCQVNLKPPCKFGGICKENILSCKEDILSTYIWCTRSSAITNKREQWSHLGIWGGEKNTFLPVLSSLNLTVFIYSLAIICPRFLFSCKICFN